MKGHAENLLMIIFGACAVLLNKYLAQATSQYAKATLGADLGIWFNRIGFILVGIFIILSGVMSW